MGRRGKIATYMSTSLDEVECLVRLDHDVMLQPSSFDARVVETGSTITAMYADVGEPKEGSIFVIDSATYTVARITDNDRVFITMQVVEER